MEAGSFTFFEEPFLNLHTPHQSNPWKFAPMLFQYSALKHYFVVVIITKTILAMIIPKVITLDSISMFFRLSFLPFMFGLLLHIYTNSCNNKKERVALLLYSIKLFKSIFTGLTKLNKIFFWKDNQQWLF